MKQLDAIIFDLDGTAMPSARDAMPNDHTCQVTKHQAEGLLLCAATGRPWPLAAPIIKALGLSAPAVISGGAVIVDPMQDKILWQLTIPMSAVDAILAVASSYEYDLTYAVDLELHEPSDVKGIEISKEPNTMYILDIENQAALEPILEKLALILGITVSKAHSWNIDGGIDLHITNAASTKEHAVAQLCDILEIDSANVAGVGDGHNDIHLFNAVGYKVAMGNAVPELKSAADVIIGNESDNGLADFIEASRSKN